jgi:hypothetical protein
MYAAMKKMAASNVLIVGLQGLGAEIGNPFTDKHGNNKLISFSYLLQLRMFVWRESSPSRCMTQNRSPYRISAHKCVLRHYTASRRVIETLFTVLPS